MIYHVQSILTDQTVSSSALVTMTTLKNVTQRQVNVYAVLDSTAGTVRARAQMVSMVDIVSSHVTVLNHTSVMQ